MWTSSEKIMYQTSKQVLFKAPLEEKRPSLGTFKVLLRLQGMRMAWAPCARQSSWRQPLYWGCIPAM